MVCEVEDRRVARVKASDGSTSVRVSGGDDSGVSHPIPRGARWRPIPGRSAVDYDDDNDIIDLTIWSGQHDTAQFLNHDNAQLSTISLFLK